ncbi:MAG: zinc ribbon domain-containing protein [Erysipelotrichaceae bacterium]|nr:zinc ribbon domain-containing protein [Erysipelotrichaceae bacterium]
MYCRRCGKKLDRNLIRCPHCGTDVVEVKQKAYSQVYEEKKQKEKEEKAARTNYPEEIGVKENVYVNYAVGTAVAAFLLAMIPWPKQWAIGTSVWMKIAILVISLMAIFNCVHGNQISNYNKAQIEKYNKRHPKDQYTYTKPGLLTFANVLAIVTALVTTFSLFMG